MNYRVLFAGGSSRDFNQAKERLKSAGIDVRWHWATRTASHRGFPKCDAAIVFTPACAHTLFDSVSSSAKKAQTPVIPHTSWAVTKLALQSAHIGDWTMAKPDAVAPPKLEPVVTEPCHEIPYKTEDSFNEAAPSPNEIASTPDEIVTTQQDTSTSMDTLTPPASPVTDSFTQHLDAMIIEFEPHWNTLAPDLRADIRQAARDSDENLEQPLPENVAQYLKQFAGNPRGFLITIILATKGAKITQSAAKRIYQLIAYRSLEAGSSRRISDRMTAWFGAEYGLRVGEGFDIATYQKTVSQSAKTPTLSVMVRPPVQTKIKAQPNLIEDFAAAQATQPTTLAPDGPTTARFNRLLVAALDAGESLRVKKVGLSFIIQYDDGTIIQIAPAS